MDNLPFELLIIIENQVRFKPIDNLELKNAVNQWCDDKITRYGHITIWNTSLVKDMSYLFAYEIKFNDSVSNWDVSQVTNMKSMFAFAEEFNQSLATWDVSQVRNMNGMFVYATEFNQPINN